MASRVQCHRGKAACGGNLYIIAYNKKELDKKEPRTIHSQGPITKDLFPLGKPHHLEDLQPLEMPPPAEDQVVDISLWKWRTIGSCCRDMWSVLPHSPKLLPIGLIRD